jgi:hypothetical protein
VLATTTFDPRVRQFANNGNEAIFDDVFPKLRALAAGPVLSGGAAKRWDEQTLAAEQNLVQPLYSAAQKGGYLPEIESGARQEGWFGLKGLLAGILVDLSPFTGGSIMSVSDRWIYGMSNMGYPTMGATMPTPPLVEEPPPAPEP